MLFRGAHRSIVLLGVCTVATTLVGAQILPGDITITLDLVAEGLTSPVALTHAGDGSGRLFVVDQAGQIRIIEDEVRTRLSEYGRRQRRDPRDELFRNRNIRVEVLELTSRVSTVSTVFSRTSRCSSEL